MLRFLARLPLWFYRSGLGWLLGNRFLRLEHVGRKSGKRRETVLEVVRFDRLSKEYVVASGFGPRADWYLNLQAQPLTRIQVGKRTWAVETVFLDAEESAQELRDYQRRHPWAYKLLGPLVLKGRVPPMVRFRPVSLA